MFPCVLYHFNFILSVSSCAALLMWIHRIDRVCIKPFFAIAGSSLGRTEKYGKANVNKLMAAIAEHMCRFCGLQHPATQGRMHGKEFECTSCATSDKMLRRNLGSRACLQPFTPQESAAFFQDIAKKKAASPNGRILWTAIRGTLVQRLTDQKVSSFKASVSGKSLPLGVWVKQGWKEDVVKGCPNYWCTDVGDQVYTVPVKEVKWSEEHARIHAQILEHEQQAAGRKRQGKRKAKDGDSSGAELDLPEAPQDEKKKQEKNPGGQRQKLLATNAALANCAAKSLGPLQNSITGLSKTAEKVQKAGITVPDEVQGILSEIMAKLEEWAAASRYTVNAHEATRELWKQEDAELPTLAKLPFQTTDLKPVQKQASELVDTLKKLLPVKEPKTKAKAKSAPKPGEADGNAEDTENRPRRRRTKGA